MVSSSHNIYIEGGVLKVLSDDEQNILYLYVRPEELDRWVAAGGGGGLVRPTLRHRPAPLGGSCAGRVSRRVIDFFVSSNFVRRVFVGGGISCQIRIPSVPLVPPQNP